MSRENPLDRLIDLAEDLAKAGPAAGPAAAGPEPPHFPGEEPPEVDAPVDAPVDEAVAAMVGELSTVALDSLRAILKMRLKLDVEFSETTQKTFCVLMSHVGTNHFAGVLTWLSRNQGAVIGGVFAVSLFMDIRAAAAAQRPKPKEKEVQNGETQNNGEESQNPGGTEIFKENE